MPGQKGQNPNHPKLGSAIKAEPIRSLTAIKEIKDLLAERPRDLCMFTVGINTAIYPKELLSINIGHVERLMVGEPLQISDSKTIKYRSILINKVSMRAIDLWLAEHPKRLDAHSPLFLGQRGRMSAPYLNNLIKSWCREIKLKGNYGSLSLRKTWGYHQYFQRNIPIQIVMEGLGQPTQKYTLDYLGIQTKELKDYSFMQL